MNQKFLVGKSPRGLPFQIQAEDSSKLRITYADPRHHDSATFKRKKRNSWRSKDESDCCLAFSKRLDHCSIKPDNVDFKNIARRNVFIDSYYPKLLGNISEDSSKISSSSHDDDQKLWLENSTESDSRKTYGKMRNIRGRPNPKFVSMVLKDNKSRDSDRATLQRSSKSRLTLNCNTYTLISLSSDLESFASKNNINIYEGLTKTSSLSLNEQQEVTEEETEEEKIENLEDSTEGSPDANSNPECFAQLYSKIEILEQLLQQTLVNSVKPKESKYTEKPETRQKFQSAKNKSALPKTIELKNQQSSKHKVRDASNGGKVIEEKENSDTENELQKIRKRLDALERRLRDSKNAETSCGEAPESPSNNSEISEENVKKNELSGTRDMKEKKSNFPKKILSEATFVVPSEFFIFSTAHGVKPEKVSANEIMEKDKRKKMSKCRRIKRKTSSIINARRKTFRPRKPALKLTNDRSKIYSVLKGNPSQSAFFDTCIALKKFSSSGIMSDTKPEKEKLVSPHIIENSKKRKHRNRLNSLCKKTSITNLIMGQKDDAGEAKGKGEGEETKQDDECLNFKSPWSPYPCWMTFSTKYPQKLQHNSLFRKNFQLLGALEKPKRSKTHSSSADPIEILKGGGKIRIPVLFEEVCKRSRSKTLGRNLSEVSMRFVLVQEDPQHPLRKLIKNFVRNPTQKAEHYLFGVSKCSCKKEVVVAI